MSIVRPLLLPDALSLAGQRVVVTGAASGIGRATASVLARLGAELLLADVGNLDATCADLAALGVTPETVQGDLLAPGAIARLFASGPVRGRRPLRGHRADCSLE